MWTEPVTGHPLLTAVTAAPEPAHPGVTVVSPSGSRRRYGLRYRLADGSTRQPQLAATATAADAREAACALSLLLRLGLPLGEPAPTTERARAGASHRGVQVLPPRAGRAYYSVRYTDPATLRIKQHKLPGVTTAEHARTTARQLHQTLQARALDVAAAGGERGIAITLADEIEAYLTAAGSRVNKHGLPTSAVTIKNYRRALARFRAWCAERERPITLLSQLTRATLADYRSARVKAPAHGRGRNVSTVNQEVKPVRQMLREAIKEGRLVHLRTEAIKDTLQRQTEADPEPRCLSVAEVQATLRAALRLDHERGRGCMGAAMIAVGLLTGLRRRELAELRASDVVFNAATEFDPSLHTGEDYIMLGRGRTKTGAPRKVATTAYSPLLGELLRALVERNGKRPRLFRLGYQALGDYAWRLRAYGAPSDLNVKMLRSTCATCQRPLAGDLKSKADRQGHTLAVAEQYYLAAPTGLPVSAPDLETVMQCAPELRAIIAIVRGGGR